MTTKSKLIPLEYCRIDRAARLLGCEEGDLIHWGAINAISLYALFGRCAGMRDSGICQINDNQWTNKPDDASFIGPMVQVELNDQAGYNLKSGIELPTLDSYGWLYGLWKVSPSRLQIMEFAPDAQDPFYVSARNDNNDIAVAGVGFSFAGRVSRFDAVVGVLGVELAKEFATSDVDFNTNASLLGLDEAEKSPPIVELKAADLWIFRKDLELVRDHIHSGKPLPIKLNDDEQAATAKMAAANDEPATRITLSQSTALVEALEQLGFTSEDFTGSIPELKAKCVRMRLPKLASVDDKTLSAWLVRGEVR